MAELVARRADDDATALLFEDRVWTWREVVAETCVRGSCLSKALDPERPPHVGVLMGNTPEYVFTLLGAALCGLTVVGLNPTRGGEELLRDITHTDCQLVLTDAAHVGLLEGLALPPLHLVDGPEWQSVLAHHRPAALPVERPEPDTQWLLIFTSGSTSAPKAVRCSQRRFARVATAMGFRAEDVLYCAMPLTHGNALASTLLPALAAGATLALREKFSASAVLPDVRRVGATFFNTVGRALSYVLATPPTPQDTQHSLRFVLAPEASPRDAEDFRARFGVMVVSGYGSSEGTLSLLPSSKPGSLGKAPPGTDVAIVDPETGVECRIAEFDDGGRLLNVQQAVGELVRRDEAATFEGYYGNLEATAERTRGGWFWSGDLGYRDAEGVFYFAGRAGDWLRVDSENFAAAPLERILARHPAVDAAVVYPVPDPRTADQVMATLQLRAGQAFDPVAFASWLTEQRDLGTKSTPRFLRLVRSMPTTGNDKIDKRPLRADGWLTDDPVWWRSANSGSYRPFTPSDAAALRAEFEEHGRGRFAPQRDEEREGAEA